jgi:hypothetical protein
MHRISFFHSQFALQSLPLRLPKFQMSVFTRVIVLFLVILAVSGPPGLCACWLIPQVETIHPHFSEQHAKSEHLHDYLFQLSQTTNTEITPLVIMSATVWIAMALTGSIWRRLEERYFQEAGWLPAIPLPPPKNEGVNNIVPT